VKIGKHHIRADKIIAVEEGKFITNMSENNRGGFFTSVLLLEGGHTISVAFDHEKAMEMWQAAMYISD
jgi:hypothetical protein